MKELHKKGNAKVKVVHTRIYKSFVDYYAEVILPLKIFENVMCSAKNNCINIFRNLFPVRMLLLFMV